MNKVNEIKSMLDKIHVDKNKVINMILRYLDSCDKKLDTDIEYYGETIYISAIKDKVLIPDEDISDIIGYHNGNKIDYRDMDYDELIELFYTISSF